MSDPASMDSYAQLRTQSADAIRSMVRQQKYCGHTAGLAAGMLQANLVILPQSHATDFRRFCEMNAKACPLVGISQKATSLMTTLGSDIDIRTDVPSYNIYTSGQLTGQTTDISNLWRENFVAFALGCSFTFERALMENGIVLQHIERNVTVPMFKTTLPVQPVGPFAGGMVVSMRPIREQDVEKAVSISARYPHAHGAPVHVGNPAELGISDLNAPDWGEACSVGSDETPVFWACGVTPQNVVLAAKPEICITHTPGCMLITDIDENQKVPVIGV